MLAINVYYKLLTSLLSLLSANILKKKLTTWQKKRQLECHMLRLCIKYHEGVLVVSIINTVLLSSAIIGYASSVIIRYPYQVLLMSLSTKFVSCMSIKYRVLVLSIINRVSVIECYYQVSVSSVVIGYPYLVLLLSISTKFVSCMSIKYNERVLVLSIINNVFLSIAIIGYPYQVLQLSISTKLVSGISIKFFLSSKHCPWIRTSVWQYKPDTVV